MPSRSLVNRFLDLLVVAYQKGIGRYLPPRCRFYPSCSKYARMSLEKDGTCRAVFKILWRLARCQPFVKGGVDFP